MIVNANHAEISVEQENVASVAKSTKMLGKARSVWSKSDILTFKSSLHDGVAVDDINNLFPLRSKGAIQKRAQAMGYRLEKGALYQGITQRHRRTKVELLAANMTSVKDVQAMDVVEIGSFAPKHENVGASIPLFVNGLNKNMPVFPIPCGTSL